LAGTRLYRIVESVGRWSIDIFMLSILAGFVQVGSIATIQPGIGLCRSRGSSLSPCSPPPRSIPA
jgi:uncharacterized paraquat-inducible protein A